jgi:hypothetical protein
MDSDPIMVHTNLMQNANLVSCLNFLVISGEEMSKENVQNIFVGCEGG